MSIIPKIKVGKPKDREQLNLDFDCSTTANIGQIQPTMCREMVPNETFHVKVASLVRLSPLTVPTFGRMSLRHYHTFVPYRAIWEPFENMLSGQNYVNDHVSAVPTKTPYFTMNDLFAKIAMNYADVSIFVKSKGEYLIFNPDELVDAETGLISQTVIDAWITNQLVPAIAPLKSGALFQTTDFKYNYVAEGGFGDADHGFVNLGNYAYVGTDIQTPYFTLPASGGEVDGNILPIPNGGSVVTMEGADYISDNGTYIYCFKLRPVARRFRQIVVGLGYQFTPYSRIEQNPFKLIAYYMAWFELFRPVREKSFMDTHCYRLIHILRQPSTWGSNVATGTAATTVGYTWAAFINDLAYHCYYYLPQDYFGMSTAEVNQNNSDVAFSLRSPVGFNLLAGELAPVPPALGIVSTHKQSDSVTSSFASVSSGISISGSGLSSNSTTYPGQSPLLMKMAMRLLTFTNKNTVIGRSIRNYLKVHYGITDDGSLDGSTVHRIGQSRTNIQISDVMSTSETYNEATQTGDFLGAYAGKGIGYGDSEKFDFTAPCFGCWITLSVIVPESGYYQGYLRENRHLTRYDFFQPEFDALGYQILERGEVMDSFCADNAAWNPASMFLRNYGFGFVPRYSEYKVGRNIVNGDLSLAGMAASFAPYTLDRKMPERAFDTKVVKIAGANNFVVNPVLKKPAFVPSVVYDDFRRIDPTDHLGAYNRIFQYQKNDIDHFIINMVFDVKAIAPMKSLSTSFDTIQNDDTVTEVTHS